jgi:hypothetical protein
MDHEQHSVDPGFWTSPSGLTLLVALAAAGFYLITEHTAHVLGVAPYLFILACPLMHIFMHHGHGQGHGALSQVRPGGPNNEQRH